MSSRARPKLDRNSGKNLVGDSGKKPNEMEPTDGEETPDWRAEMRQEIREAISEVLSERPMNLPPGEREINQAYRSGKPAE